MTLGTDTIDYAAIYRGVRQRVSDLVRDLPAVDLAREVPATPGWSVQDVVAHLAGVTADSVEGNTEGLASDAWTAAQVDARRGRSIAELLEEWDRCSGLVEPAIADLPGLIRIMLLTDAANHEHDIRGALGQAGARDSDVINFAFNGVAPALGAQQGELGALRIVHDAGEMVIGEGDPTATLTTTRFEVVRAAVGRRSPDQIAAWNWDGQPRPEVMVFSMFAPGRSEPLVE